MTDAERQRLKDALDWVDQEVDEPDDALWNLVAIVREVLGELWVIGTNPPPELLDK